MLHIYIVGVVSYSDNLSRVSLNFFSIYFIITLHSSIAATSALQYKKKKLKFNNMLSILVDNAADYEQLAVNITSNFPK